MITIPIVFDYKDIAVFPDDINCNQYYLIRTTPRIRINEDGTPVFKATFWSNKHTDIAGGRVNFDVNLQVTDEEKEIIKKKLKAAKVPEQRRKKIVKDEKDRQIMKLKAQGEKIIDEKTLDLEGVQEVGNIFFSPIHFTSGKIDLLEDTKDGGHISYLSTKDGQKPSLFGDNNSACALTLTSEGGEVWYRSLMERSHAIGVKYDLTFQIKVPSIEIRAYAGSMQADELNKKIEKWVNSKSFCGITYSKKTHYEVAEITRQLVDMGLIHIEINQGEGSELTQEYIASLRDSVMGILQNKIEEIIKSRIPDNVTEEQLKDKYLRTFTKELSSFVELRFTQSDIINYPIAPQATIYEFFEEVSDKALKKAISLIDLSKQSFPKNEITVSASAPWQEDPFVTRVDLTLEYPSATKNKKKTFNLTEGKSTDTWVFDKPNKDTGEVKYITSVYTKNHKDPYVFPQETSFGNVFVNIPKIGMVDLTFKSHPNLVTLTGNNEVTSIQVDIWYKDKKNKTLLEDSFVLRPEDEAGFNYKRDLGTILDRPIYYKVTYSFAKRESIETDPMSFYLTEDGVSTIYTPFPFKDILNVKLFLPFVPDDSVSSISVDFKYEDQKNDFVSYAYAMIAKDPEDDEEVWPTEAETNMVVIDKSIDTFKYMYRLFSKDGNIISNWLDGKGESSITLPIQKVTVAAGLLKIGEVYYRGTLTIRSLKDDSVIRSITLNDNNKDEDFSFYLEGPVDKVPSFKYILQLFDMEGNPSKKSDTHTGTTLVLTPPKAKTASDEKES